MKYVCIWLIRLYQKYLSPLKRYPTCRFTPTCSSYAAQAFMERGFFVGLYLTVWRVLRCNPFSAGGYDPVPKKRRRGDKKCGCADICDDRENTEIKTGENPSSGGTGEADGKPDRRDAGRE